MKTEIRNTIESSISESKSHLQKIERSRGLLKELFPVNVQAYTGFSEDQIEHIDQFIYRFTKMQDSMGMRLIPSLYTWLEDDNKPRPFLDILNRFEKLGIIKSVEDWQFFRNLRNSLSHDYPETIAQTVETLNLLFNEITKFLSIFLQLEKTWKERSI